MRPARPNRRLRTAFWIDKWLGPILCTLLGAALRLMRHSANRRAPQIPSRILVLKFWGIGSIVFATPLLRELRARYPRARIDFVTLAENRVLIDQLTDVDHCYPIDLSDGIASFLRQTWTVIRAVRGGGYDLLLDLEFFTSFSALFSGLAGAGFTCGFSSRGSVRGRLHDRPIPFNSYHHVVLNFLALLGQPDDPLPKSAPLPMVGESAEFAPDRSPMLPALRPSAEGVASIQTLLRNHPTWRPGRRLVVVNPNTGELALERRWPEERMAEFLKSLLLAPDVNVVVTGSSGERGFVAYLLAASGTAPQVINLAGEISLTELIALLSLADVVVSNDSGPLHLAAAVGASTVSLFGPETPVLYGPLQSTRDQIHKVHYQHLPCSPCMNVHDNKMLSCWFVEAACMQYITAEDVLASTRAILASQPN